MPSCDVKVTARTARLFTISFDLNGGTLNGQSGTVTMVLEEGTLIVLGKPVRDGYTFRYWQVSVHYAGEVYEVTEDHDLTAVWDKNVPVNTGDDSLIGLYVYLLAVCLAGIAAVMMHRRKKDTVS